ncbi:MAG: FAD-dependent monooxygenase, partial [Methyloligellaceae bacterium]
MGGDNKRFDVLIAGGSFVGLTQAIALAQASRGSLRVAVADRTPLETARARSNDGRASAHSAASKHLFSSLGIWSQVESQVQPITGIDITDTRLGSVVRPTLLHFDSVLPDGEPAAYMLENHRLRDALISRARETAGLTFLAPESVLGFQVDMQGVTARLERSGDVNAALLIAADGRKSALRKQAGIKTIGWSYPQAGIVVTLALEKPHQGRAIQHFLPAGPFALLPLPDNRASLVWTEARARAREIVALDDAEFLREADKRIGGRFGDLKLAGPRVAFPLDMHLARAFVSERLALVGDAAHGGHPLAGQGLNIGLRDVAALAEVVVEAARLGLDPGSAPVLERYQRWRRFDSAFSGLAMDALNRLFTYDNAPARAIRSLGLGLVDRTPILKRFFVREAAGLTGTIPR